MVRPLEHHDFSMGKRERLAFLLTKAGFVLVKNTFGYHVYAANPQEGDAKIGNHFLPSAFLRGSSYTPLHQNEPSMKKYHDKIREAYLSVTAKPLPD